MEGLENVPHRGIVYLTAEARSLTPVGEICANTSFVIKDKGNNYTVFELEADNKDEAITKLRRFVDRIKQIWQQEFTS